MRKLAKGRNRLVADIGYQHQQHQTPQDTKAKEECSELAVQAYDQFSSQRIEQLDFQTTQDLPINFVQLFRQHTHYKRLGISLTPPDLLYMEDYSRKNRKRHDVPTLSMCRVSECQDNIIQTEANALQLKTKQRLEGGFRLDAVNSLAQGSSKHYKKTSKNNLKEQSYFDDILTDAQQYKQPNKKRTETRLCKKSTFKPETDPSATELVCTCGCCDSRWQKQDQAQKQGQRRAAALSEGRSSINGKQSTHRAHAHTNESEDDMQSYELRRTSVIINLPTVVAAESSTLHDIRERHGTDVMTLLSPRAFRLTQSKSLACVPPKVDIKVKLTPTSSQSASSKISTQRASSTDTLNDVWSDPDAYKMNSTAERPHQWSSELQNVGWAGAVRLDAASKRAAFVRSEKYGMLHRKMSREQRAQGILWRLQQLRRYQEKSCRHYHRSLVSNDESEMHCQKPRRVSNQLYECPMRTPDCSRLRSEALLAHFLAVHLSEPSLALTEVGQRDQLLIKFKPMAFDRSRNVCLSMIVYTRELGTKPAAEHNVGLPSEYAKYAGHLPIFVLACRTRMRAASKGKVDSEQKKERRGLRTTKSVAASDEDIEENVLAIWMVSLEVPQPLHAHLTIFNRRLDIIRSSIVRVRGLRKCHNFQRFFEKSKNYMRLNEHDLQLLTENYNEPIYLELTLRDYALIDPPAAKQPK